MGLEAAGALLTAARFLFMQKLYCYVDETGQDTKGTLFLVALVITGDARETLRKALVDYERRSGKSIKKWTNTTLEQKKTYLQEVLQVKLFQGRIFYRSFSHTTDYLDCTIEAIVQGIAKQAIPDYKVTVVIDSLGKREGKTIGTRLRRRGIRVEKVRGVPHRSDEFIRLADAMAGFVRDYLEGKHYANNLYQQAMQSSAIVQL